MRTGCPDSNVDIRNQKSKWGEREGSMPTTFGLAWLQTLCKLCLPQAPLAQERSVLPLVAVPGLDDPAALPAVRKRRRDILFGKVGGFIWLAHFPLDQPIYIRLHHPLVFGGQFIQLVQFAGVRLV